MTETKKVRWEGIHDSEYFEDESIPVLNGIRMIQDFMARNGQPLPEVGIDLGKETRFVKMDKLIDQFGPNHRAIGIALFSDCELSKQFIEFLERDSGFTRTLEIHYGGDKKFFDFARRNINIISNLARWEQEKEPSFLKKFFFPLDKFFRVVKNIFSTV